MSLEDDLRKMSGLDIFGVADALSCGSKAPEGHRPEDFLKGARSVVLIGTRMLDVPLDGLPGTRQEYTANFHVVNSRLNDRLFELAGFLQEQGHKVFPVPYTEMPGWNLDKRPAWLAKALRGVMTAPGLRDVFEKRTWGVLSYRHMAAEAGLGEVGVSNLLLTPQHGPRVRLVAMVTDVELEPGRPLEHRVCVPERCGYACVKACPAGALNKDGRPTDKVRCLKHYMKLGMPGQSGVRCGLCVARCPAARIAGRTAEAAGS